MNLKNVEQQSSSYENFDQNNFEINGLKPFLKDEEFGTAIFDFF